MPMLQQPAVSYPTVASWHATILKNRSFPLDHIMNLKMLWPGRGVRHLLKSHTPSSEIT